MRKHDYLNLKIGIVEQYSMVVKKKQLDFWRSSGWLEYTEVKLPEGDEDAWMLYGEMKKSETLIFNRPVLLRNVPLDNVIGKLIKGISCNLGKYGMGGPGFFGLLMDSDEYLTYVTWGSGSYVLVNNIPVECDTKVYHKVRPWVSNFWPDLQWDNLSGYIAGSIIKDIAVSEYACNLICEKNNERIEINFVRNDIRLPRKTGRIKNAFKKGQISDYLIFQHKNGTLIV